MGEDIYYNRTALLRTFTAMGFPQSAKHETMLLFWKLRPEQKEEAAQRAIPLVRACKTGEEAIAAVAGVIDEMATK